MRDAREKARFLKRRRGASDHSERTPLARTHGAHVRIDIPSHSFGSVPVLDNIADEVAPGEFVAILGPSGCGKSTLIRIVGGLVEASRGQVWIDSTEVRGPSNSVGMVFQDDALLEWRTVLDNVMLPIEIKRLPRDEGRRRALELLEQVGLTDFAHARPSQLSGGMKQRVAICQALVHGPRLLLMDEPFGALDALTRKQMQIDLEQLWQRTGTTVLFITHSVSEAVLLADRVLVMAPRPTHPLREYRPNLPRPRSLGVEREQEYLAITESIDALLQSVGILRTSSGATPSASEPDAW